MFQAMSSATSAVRAYTRGVLVNAQNLANVQTTDYRPQDTVYLSNASEGVRAEVTSSPEPQPVDEAKELIGLAANRRAIQANIAVFRASDKTLGVLLDTVA